MATIFSGFSTVGSTQQQHYNEVDVLSKFMQQTKYPSILCIDMNEVRELAKKEKPKLIICGASAYSRDWDYERLRAIADSVNALLLADISHPSGLIARGLLNDPMPHCHVVTTTTHKTLRGPRGGLIMMGKDFENPWGLKTPKGEIKMMSAILDGAVFPGT